jgi:hypothetical protein
MSDLHQAIAQRATDFRPDGTPPFSGLRARKRRRDQRRAGAAVALSIAAVVGVAVGRSVFGPTSGGLAHPGPSTSSLPTQSPIRPTDVAPCRANNLTATYGGTDHGNGITYQDIVLHNIGPSPCLLDGRLVGLTGVEGGVRRAIPVHLEQAFRGVRPAVIGPTSGVVALYWYGRCDTPPDVSHTVTHVQLTLLSGALAVDPTTATDGLDLGCLGAGAAVSASALGGYPSG